MCLINTVRVAYYEPAYYEHSFIMNQAEGEIVLVKILS